MFEDQILQIQNQILNQCVSYLGSTDKIFLYASSQDKTLEIDFFYQKDNKFFKKHQLENKNNSTDTQFALLNILIKRWHEILDIFHDNNQEIPSEMKLIYNNKSKNLTVNYRYNSKSSEDNAFNKWFEEIKTTN